MTAPADIVFLFDVDNTLLDNDRITGDLRQHLVRQDAVEGRMLIYIRKERMLEAVQARCPARRYVMVDDKLRILAAMKNAMGNRLCTVFPRQGHYALDPRNDARYPPADLTIGRIGDLARFDLSAFSARPDAPVRSQA